MNSNNNFDEGLTITEFIKKKLSYVLPYWLFPFLVYLIALFPLLPFIIKAISIPFLLMYLFYRLVFQLKELKIGFWDRMLILFGIPAAELSFITILLQVISLMK